VSASTTVTGSADVNPCPSCGNASGVQVITNTPPRVRAWFCAACRTDWAIAVVNPRPFLDYLTATVELAAARSVLREVITLADQAPMLTDEQLRFRLRALAECGRHPDPPLLLDPRSAAGRALIPPTRLPAAGRPPIPLPP
jgi:hypothetical protein